MDTIVLYHGGCRDGFCAAWVVKKYFNDNFIKGPFEFIPAYYGQDPPDVTDKDVIIVDFCYPLEVMMDLIEECKSLHILDHHKTAMPVFDSIGKAIDNGELDHLPRKRIRITRDLEKSGAGIAWDYFFPNQLRPWIVNYVEDRDLWTKKLNNTEEINAYISILKFDFKEWDDCYDNLLDCDAADYGKVILEKTEQYVREVCKNAYFVDFNPPNRKLTEEELDDLLHDKNFTYRYENIPIVNICQIDCSEVLHELCKRYPESEFSLYWFRRSDGMYQYGLRSIGDFDVSEVAKLFGGGGHRNAAGFQLKYLLKELG